MKYLFIDTNIYVQCCLLQIEGDDIGALKKVHDLLNDDRVTLLLPEVVELELYKILNLKGEEIKKKIGSYQETINKDSDLDEKIKRDLVLKIKEVAESRSTNTEKAIKEIEVLLKSKGTAILRITPNQIISSYKQFLSGRKPYKEGQPGSIQPDCLIIDALSEYLSDKTNYDLYFCSSNTEDFSVRDDKEIKIHPEIKSRFGHIKFYSNLYELLNKEFEATYSKESIEKLDEKKAEIDNYSVSNPWREVTSDIFTEQIRTATNSLGSLEISRGSILTGPIMSLAIDKVAERATVLRPLLRDCRVIVEGDNITLYVKFKFHFDRLTQFKVPFLLSEAIKSLTGSSYTVECKIGK